MLDVTGQLPKSPIWPQKSLGEFHKHVLKRCAEAYAKNPTGADEVVRAFTGGASAFCPGAFPSSRLRSLCGALFYVSRFGDCECASPHSK